MEIITKTFKKSFHLNRLFLLSLLIFIILPLGFMIIEGFKISILLGGIFLFMEIVLLTISISILINMFQLYKITINEYGLSYWIGKNKIFHSSWNDIILIERGFDSFQKKPRLIVIRRNSNTKLILKKSDFNGGDIEEMFNIIMNNIRINPNISTYNNGTIAKRKQRLLKMKRGENKLKSPRTFKQDCKKEGYAYLIIGSTLVLLLFIGGIICHIFESTSSVMFIFSSIIIGVFALLCFLIAFLSLWPSKIIIDINQFKSYFGKKVEISFRWMDIIEVESKWCGNNTTSPGLAFKSIRQYYVIVGNEKYSEDILRKIFQVIQLIKVKYPDIKIIDNLKWIN